LPDEGGASTAPCGDEETAPGKTICAETGAASTSSRRKERTALIIGIYSVHVRTRKSVVGFSFILRTLIPKV
jgi:hypothetical protein